MGLGTHAVMACGAVYFWDALVGMLRVGVLMTWIHLSGLIAYSRLAAGRLYAGVPIPREISASLSPLVDRGPHLRAHRSSAEGVRVPGPLRCRGRGGKARLRCTKCLNPGAMRLRVRERVQ
jgi:hypothetical protein